MSLAVGGIGIYSYFYVFLFSVSNYNVLIAYRPMMFDTDQVEWDCTATRSRRGYYGHSGRIK